MILYIFSGEATNLNLAHVMNVDCTDVNDLTMAEMEGRRQAMFALKVKTNGGLYGRAYLIIMIDNYQHALGFEQKETN